MKKALLSLALLALMAMTAIAADDDITFKIIRIGFDPVEERCIQSFWNLHFCSHEILRHDCGQGAIAFPNVGQFCMPHGCTGMMV